MIKCKSSELEYVDSRIKFLESLLETESNFLELEAIHRLLYCYQQLKNQILYM